jgi:hypothetical protein
MSRVRTTLTRSAPSSLALLALLAAACGPNSAGGGVDATGAGADALVDGLAGPDALVCTGGTLCGQPATCCDAGNECVDDRCLPTCASGVRCGADLTVCCDAGTVCLGNTCTVPGRACTDSYDCDPGQFCEPTLGQCLPQPDPLTCQLVPSFGALSVVTEWSYVTEEIISIPVVANLDNAGAPEVVVNVTQMDGLGYPGGRIAILDGATGAIELAPLPHAPPTSYGSHGRATIATGDVSGDGLPDVVYVARYGSGGAARSLIVAIDRTGALLWRSHSPAGADYGFQGDNMAVTLANFDADLMAEVVVGGTLLDHDGTVLWDQGGSGAGTLVGTNDGYTGGIAAVADLDGDGDNEIVTGRQAWQVAWTAGPPASAVVSPYWTATAADGYPAVADLDLDGKPEVVLVASRQVHVLHGQSGRYWCGVDPTEALCMTSPALRSAARNLPGQATSNRGGPPTIADFDDDGRPEIGVAGGYAYAVFDLNRPGEDIAGVSPAPALGATFIRWQQATQDLSSNATGSSVFDFQGDGAAEVVYADECFLRVYDGRTGAVQLETPNTTGTIHEYPLVVDVDADGNSEILVVANDTNASADCGAGVSPRQGLYVYGDANDEWVPTRRVWTQHSYHVTNTDSVGNVPLVEAANWTTAGLNNYRQNVQGEGIFNAPDLAVELSIALAECARGEFILRARVSNLGALGVPAGIPVVFYAGTDATGAVLATTMTTIPLLPGQSTSVTTVVPVPTGARADYFVTVDGGGGAGVVAECDDDNNDDVATGASCPIIE